jgi:hypothetical protein
VPRLWRPNDGRRLQLSLVAHVFGRIAPGASIAMPALIMKLGLRSPGLAFVLLSALSLASAACTVSSPGTGGTDTGKLDFAYESGTCLFGCSVGGHAMMLGTSESLSAQTSEALSGVTVTVDDPSVVQVAAGSVELYCNSSSNGSSSATLMTGCPSGTSSTVDFGIVARGAGTTKLHVLQAGTEVDGIDLVVEAPATITPTCSVTGSASALRVGSQCTIGWTATDAQGNALQASSGVSLVVANPAVADLTGFFSPGTGSEPDASDGIFSSTALKALSPGSTTLTASAGSASATLPVDVTSP